MATNRSGPVYGKGVVRAVGHAQPRRVYVERDRLGYDVVWAAAGRDDSVFAITPQRLLEISGGESADLKT